MIQIQIQIQRDGARQTGIHTQIERVRMLPCVCRTKEIHQARVEVHVCPCLTFICSLLKQ